ncbi:MAG: hypothetical protein AAFO07_25760 [Bacteroidota bacterium]
MKDLIIKINQLEPLARKELFDFLDFLLFKQRKEELGNKEEYQNDLLEVSVWSEDDIKDIEEAQKQMKTWRIEEW